MKSLKLLLIITLITFSSCSSPDDNVDDTTPITQEAKATLDVNALKSQNGNDATHLIKFNGVAADQYTTEALIGDKILYIIDANDANTIIRFIEYGYASGSDNLWESLESVHDGAGFLTGLKVKDGATFNDEVKFDIKFQLEENGVLQTQKTYLIDPKIKIKSKR